MKQSKTVTLTNLCKEFCPLITIKDKKHTNAISVPMLMVFELPVLSNLNTDRQYKIKDFKNGKAEYEVYTNELTDSLIAQIDKELEGK